jgi:hypothetical protein
VSWCKIKEEEEEEIAPKILKKIRQNMYVRVSSNKT